MVVTPEREVRKNESEEKNVRLEINGRMPNADADPGAEEKTVNRP
jgi:hypothetical protein